MKIAQQKVALASRLPGTFDKGDGNRNKWLGKMMAEVSFQNCIIL